MWINQTVNKWYAKVQKCRYINQTKLKNHILVQYVTCTYIIYWYNVLRAHTSYIGTICYVHIHHILLKYVTCTYTIYWYNTLRAHTFCVHCKSLHARYAHAYELAHNFLKPVPHFEISLKLNQEKISTNNQSFKSCDFLNYSGKWVECSVGLRYRD